MQVPYNFKIDRRGRNLADIEYPLTCSLFYVVYYWGFFAYTVVMLLAVVIHKSTRAENLSSVIGHRHCHYSDVIMSAMASQITVVSTVY